MVILSKHLERWDKIDTPYYVKKWHSEGVSISFISEPPPNEFENDISNSEEEEFIDNKLSEYLNNNFISEVSEKPTCISPLGCAKKKGNEKYRVITDMRYVNQFINVPKIRYEDLSNLSSIVQNNDLYASVDLKDGFNNIRLNKTIRTFFGFKWKKNIMSGMC